MLGVILVVIAIVLSVMIFNGQTKERENSKPTATKSSKEDKDSGKETGQPNIDKETVPPSKTKAPDKENNKEDGDKTKEPEKTKEPKKTKEPNKDEGNKDNPTCVVPESTAVGDEYFKGALFIGDSRIEGFSMLSGIKNAKFYADKGLNIGQMENKEFVKIDGKKYTVFKALEKEKYDKVYIKLGVNELGWQYYTKYITYYEALIDQIKATQPEAQIYVMEVIQVTKSKSDSNDVYTKANVDKMNGMLMDMVANKGVNYLKVNEVLTGEDGYLVADAANDGVHLKQSYCKKWLEYIKTHTVQ